MNIIEHYSLQHEGQLCYLQFVSHHLFNYVWGRINAMK